MSNKVKKITNTESSVPIYLKEMVDPSSYLLRAQSLSDVFLEIVYTVERDRKFNILSVIVLFESPLILQLLQVKTALPAEKRSPYLENVVRMGLQFYQRLTNSQVLVSEIQRYLVAD